jgi:formate-dependent nitrite reductase membrane component NrfD
LVRPLVGVVGLVTLGAALGGPRAVFNLSFTRDKLIAASISAAIGLAFVLWILWRPWKIAARVDQASG